MVFKDVVKLQIPLLLPALMLFAANVFFIDSEMTVQYKERQAGFFYFTWHLRRMQFNTLYRDAKALKRTKIIMTFKI